MSYGRPLYTARCRRETRHLLPDHQARLYRGKLRAVKTPGGHYRIHERDIEAMLHPGPPSAIKQKKLTSSVSGRNQLVGKVVQVRFDGLLAQVKLAIGDQMVTAVITADAARELQLRPGIKAAALSRPRK